MEAFSRLFLAGAIVFAAVSLARETTVPGQERDLGPAPSVIFIHPDGMGANTWAAGRILIQGPDGTLNWDRLPGLALYRGHMKDALTATSNGGATSHAWGIKVAAENSLGTDGGRPIRALSGASVSVMREAKAKGVAIGIVNSAGVVDAGTAAFLASTRSRREYAEIARQIMEAGTDVVLGGGERWFLPKGVKGRHGEGGREDGRDLIREAREAGYTVVFDREELARVPAGTRKLLGLFAHEDTFSDDSEEDLAKKNLPLYEPQAPTLAEMVAAALRALEANPKGFFLVAEEEATDNFGGENNARGVFEAIRRADEAIGVAHAFVLRRPQTLLVTASDSDCGGMQVKAFEPGELAPGENLPARDDNGAPMDGVNGTGTQPFMSAPDRSGRRMPFGVVWASEGDLAGGGVVRASGLNAGLVRGSFDNTDIYRLIYRTLFGRVPR
jgi:alkaline phosphatase